MWHWTFLWKIRYEPNGEHRNDPYFDRAVVVYDKTFGYLFVWANIDWIDRDNLSTATNSTRFSLWFVCQANIVRTIHGSHTETVDCFNCSSVDASMYLLLVHSIRQVHCVREDYIIAHARTHGHGQRARTIVRCHRFISTYCMVLCNAIQCQISSLVFPLTVDDNIEIEFLPLVFILILLRLRLSVFIHSKWILWLGSGETIQRSHTSPNTTYINIWVFHTNFYLSLSLLPAPSLIVSQSVREIILFLRAEQEGNVMWV